MIEGILSATNTSGITIICRSWCGAPNTGNQFSEARCRNVTDTENKLNSATEDSSQQQAHYKYSEVENFSFAFEVRQQCVNYRNSILINKWNAHEISYDTRLNT